MHATGSAWTHSRHLEAIRTQPFQHRGYCIFVSQRFFWAYKFADFFYEGCVALTAFICVPVVTIVSNYMGEVYRCVPQCVRDFTSYECQCRISCGRVYSPTWWCLWGGGGNNCSVMVLFFSSRRGMISSFLFLREIHYLFLGPYPPLQGGAGGKAVSPGGGGGRRLVVGVLWGKFKSGRAPPEGGGAAAGWPRWAPQKKIRPPQRKARPPPQRKAIVWFGGCHQGSKRNPNATLGVQLHIQVTDTKPNRTVVSQFDHSNSKRLPCHVHPICVFSIFN